MHCRITINFTGGSLQNGNMQSFGKSQHIDRTMYAGLYRLDGITLIMDGGGRTGKVENGIALHVQGESDIMADQFKIFIIHQVKNIPFCSGIKIIHTNHTVTQFQQSFTKKRTQKTAAACYKKCFSIYNMIP